MSTMPRVVSDQRNKFENDELFRKLGRESEIRYTGYRDRPQEERQMRFVNSCREGHAQLSFVATGTNLHLQFYPNSWSETSDRKPTKEYVDFDKENGKVNLKSQFILNGVCVIWKGCIDISRLDGVGYVEFDAQRAKEEDMIYRATMEQQNRRLREFEERQRLHREEIERAVGTEARRRGGHTGAMAHCNAAASNAHC
ncbi:core-binding factor subunit beta-like [Diadema antillarum]|uniref:core-binding factor subunit beta-like n=1 Tax=Diadema antillarum TaxID=105358 RepID=UPI003A866B5F